MSNPTTDTTAETSTGTSTPVTKLTRLTSLNTAALRETLTDTEQRGVTIGASVATFEMSAADAWSLVRAAQQRALHAHGGQGHPVQSLHAVVRKLAHAAATAAEATTDAGQG